MQKHIYLGNLENSQLMQKKKEKKEFILNKILIEQFYSTHCQESKIDIWSDRSSVVDDVSSREPRGPLAGWHVDQVTDRSG